MNSPFSAVDDTGGECPFWQQQSLSISCPRQVAGYWCAGGGPDSVAQSGTSAAGTRRVEEAESGAGTGTGSPETEEAVVLSPSCKDESSSSNAGLTSVWAPR